MLLDRQLALSEAQDLAQTQETYLSTNVADLGAPGTSGAGRTLNGNLGLGTSLYLHLAVGTAFTSDDAATVDIQLVAADNAALTTNPVTLKSTGVLAYTVLAAGHRPTALNGEMPPTTKRFVGLKYVIADFPTTAGTITAAISLDRQSGGGVVY